MNKDKILVVDDEPLIFDSIEDTVGDDYQVYHAENGAVGLKMYAEYQPILIILDIRMPVMDGFEFLKRIGVSANDPHSIIVLSGHAVGSDISTCYDMGITAFLRKPFNVFELKGLVKQCILAKKQYQSLLQEKRYIRAILEHSMDMIVSLNGGFKIVEFNPAAEKTFGYQLTELKGTPFKKLFADAVKFDAVEAFLFTGRTFSGEISMLRKNGEVFPAFLKFAVLRDAEGRPIGSVGEMHALDQDKHPVGAVGGVRDMTMEKKLAKLQRAKRDIDVVKVLVETMKDRIFNSLNGLQLLRFEAASAPTVHKGSVAIFDESIKSMTSFIKKLGEMETFSTITVGKTRVFDVDGKYQKK